MRSIIRSLVLAAGALALSALPAFAAGIQGNVQRNFNVANGGRLVVDTDIGAISVHASNKASVDVLLKREAQTTSRSKADDIFKRFNVSMTQQGNDVVVKVRYQDGFNFFHFWDDAEVVFDITVPSHYNVNVKTSGGSIEIGDLAGEVIGNTSGGSIRVGRITGSVDVHTSGGSVEVVSSTAAMKVGTSGGSIRVGDVISSADVRTSGGSITVDHSHGDLSAYTSGGGIQLEDVAGKVNASTSGGSVHARITGPLRGNSRLSSSGGGVHVSLARSVAAAIDAQSSGGGVSSDVPVTILGKQDDDSLRGTVNGGGPSLVLRSNGGGVHINKG
jgi:hypothetical protein